LVFWVGASLAGILYLGVGYMRWVIVLVCLFVLYGPPAWAEKPEPPARLALVFNEVVQIEDHVSQDLWEEAIANGNNVSEVLEAAAPSIRKVAGEDLYQGMSNAVSLMQKSLLERDRHAVYDRLLELENALFFHGLRRNKSSK